MSPGHLLAPAALVDAPGARRLAADPEFAAVAEAAWSVALEGKLLVRQSICPFVEATSGAVRRSVAPSFASPSEGVELSAFAPAARRS